MKALLINHNKINKINKNCTNKTIKRWFKYIKPLALYIPSVMDVPAYLK